MNARAQVRFTHPQAAFLSWLRVNHPNLYQQSLPEGGMSGLFDSLASGFKSIVSNASSALSTYVTGKEQMELLKLNVARAKAGLHPVTSLQQVYEPARPASAFGNIPTWAIVTGVGVLAFLLFSRR